jgi:hypothetical protein
MRRTALVPIIGALMLALLAPSAMAQPSGRAALVTEVPFTAEVTDASAAETAAGNLDVGDTFTGVLTLTNISWDAASETLLFSGEAFADGPVGDLLDGAPLGTFVNVPGTLSKTTASTGLVASLAGTQVAQGGGQCQILLLELDGLFLDLLGLQVTLDPVRLDITAVQGPGNLLGNLLCAVVGILDPQQTRPIDNLVNQLTRLLNRINNLIGA